MTDARFRRNNSVMTNEWCESCANVNDYCKVVGQGLIKASNNFRIWSTGTTLIKWRRRRRIYVTTWSTPIPVGAWCRPRGELSPGYAHRVGVPLRGVTSWGCNLRGVNLQGGYLRHSSGPRSASATKLRQQLHWLWIRQRITYNISLITYKIRTTGTPTYLFNLIRDYYTTRTLRSYNKLLLTIPRMSLTMSAESFSLSSPSVWNSLPYSCRSTKTDCFQTCFKDGTFCPSLRQPLGLAFLFTRLRFTHDLWRLTNVHWLIDWLTDWKWTFIVSAMTSAGNLLTVEIGHRSFPVVGPLERNAVPCSTCHFRSFTSCLSNHLKTYHFRRCYTQRSSYARIISDT